MIFARVLWVFNFAAIFCNLYLMNIFVEHLPAGRMLDFSILWTCVITLHLTYLLFKHRKHAFWKRAKAKR